MREVVENKAEITKQEARELVERCLKVLYYRDARSYNRVSSLPFNWSDLMSEKIIPTKLWSVLNLTEYLIFADFSDNIQEKGLRKD